MLDTSTGNLTECLAAGKRRMRIGNQCDITAFMQNLGLAYRPGREAVSGLPRAVIKGLVLEKEHRIRILYGFFQHRFRHERVCRTYYLQPRNIEEHGLQRLGVLAAMACSAAHRSAEHQRTAELACTHISQFGGMVDDRIGSKRAEVSIHNLDNWMLAEGGSACSHACEGLLAHRSLENL